MESTKNHHHHHQLQDQNAGCSSSSSLVTPSDYYGLGTTINAWSTTPTSFLDTSSGFTLYPSEPILSSRQPQLQENTSTLSQYMNSSMEFPVQLVFHNWANATNDFLTTQSIQDLQPPRIKEESSEHYYPEHTDLLTSNERKNSNVTELGMNLMLKFSQSEDLSNKILPRNLLYPRQILPSENVSSLNQMGTVTNVESLDRNIEGLDFLTFSSFDGNFGVSLEDRIGILRDGFPIYSAFDDHMQQCNEISFYGSSKIPDPVGDGSMEAKHSSTTMAMGEKAPLQNVTKKSRLEGRARSIGVRREKLGDRIAALQQLVAPFGKTDTATVLKEAIGYIKFLQDQVETLSMPYMKASRNKSNGVVMADPMGHNEKEEEPKGDMRSRGLCLVPLSCFSYITQGGGGPVWPPPHFGGAV